MATTDTLEHLIGETQPVAATAVLMQSEEWKKHSEHCSGQITGARIEERRLSDQQAKEQAITLQALTAATEAVQEEKGDQAAALEEHKVKSHQIAFSPSMGKNTSNTYVPNLAEGQCTCGEQFTVATTPTGSFENASTTYTTNMDTPDANQQPYGSATNNNQDAGTLYGMQTANAQQQDAYGAYASAQSSRKNLKSTYIP